MDAELREFLVGMEERLTGRMDQRLTGMQERLTGVESGLVAMEQRLTQHADQRVEQLETKLLTAFHAWARAMEIRVRGSVNLVTGFDERLALLEERVGQLERKGL